MQVHKIDGPNASHQRKPRGILTTLQHQKRGGGLEMRRDMLKGPQDVHFCRSFHFAFQLIGTPPCASFPPIFYPSSFSPLVASQLTTLFVMTHAEWAHDPF